MYGWARVREWATVRVPARVRRVTAALRAAPLATALAAAAAAMTITTVVSSVRGDHLGVNAIVELIIAALALSVAIAEGSPVARMQRAGNRRLRSGRGRGLQR